MINPTMTNVFLQFLLLDKSTFSFIPDNYFNYLQYAPIFLIAFITAFLLTPILGSIAKRFNIIDNPINLRKNKWNKFDNPERHTHKNPMPFLGGFAVLIPLLILSPLLLIFQGEFVFLYIGLIILSISGFIDEKYNMPSIWQLILQFIAIFIFALTVTDLDLIKIPFDGILNTNLLSYAGTIGQIPFSLSFPGDLILIGWILLSLNAIKWLNGVDALLEGNLIIAFSFILILAIRGGNITVILMSAIIIGALLGLIIYIFPPAKIYIGSAGKTVLGFLVASFAFLIDTKFSISLIIILLPVLDAIYVIITRYLRERPKNPFDIIKMNGRDHFHHKLQDLGLNAIQILMIEVSIALLINSIAVFNTQAYRYFTLLLGIFIILSLIITVNIISKKRKSKVTTKETPESKYSY